MKLKDIKTIFHKELDAIYGENEVGSFFKNLIKHHLNLNRIALVLEPDLTLTKSEEQPLFEALSKLKNNEPLQYIIGVTEFFELPFKVNKNTLIPRPETEELVSHIIHCLSVLNEESQLKIIDIGTGTGCIAIALAKNIKNAEVFAVDVSEEALKMAKHNAELNAANIICIQDDILKPSHSELIKPSQKFNIIVSNPPYVRALEKKDIKKNVLEFEPHLALFVPDDNPLKFYKAIAKFAVDNLSENGLLFFEINQYLGEQMKQLLEHFEFRNIELLKDIFGNDRIIKASKP